MIEDLGYANEEQFHANLPLLMNFLAHVAGEKAGGKLFFGVDDLNKFCETSWRASMRFIRDLEDGKNYIVYIVDEYKESEDAAVDNSNSTFDSDPE